MELFMIQLLVWVVLILISWLKEKRREHINQNRNAVMDGVAKN